MNNIALTFSIKDLENFTQIKAHTIRIWEKRYGILDPNRKDTNIRLYSLSEFQKLLNVSVLYKHGVKISAIAKLNEAELSSKVLEVSIKESGKEKFISTLMLSILRLDQALFERTYDQMVAEMPFKQIFLEVFIPLLHNVGIKWQSNNITPVHEHFVSNLIKQKLLLNIERVNKAPNAGTRTYVLFLPHNEIHELGLMYIHYELVLRGVHSIYLGTDVPLENLSVVSKLFGKATFISYFTVSPVPEEVNNYIQEFNNLLLKDGKSDFHFGGSNAIYLSENPNQAQIKFYTDIKDLITSI